MEIAFIPGEGAGAVVGPEDDLDIQLPCNFEGTNEKLIGSELTAMREPYAPIGKGKTMNC